MRKIITVMGLLAGLLLNATGATMLKVVKPDNSSQEFNIATVSSITFSDPGTRKLKICKTDGTELLVALSTVHSLTFVDSVSIADKEELFSRLSLGLVGNYPNPFNPATTVTFSTASSGVVKVAVYNQAGQLVSTLHNGHLSAGRHAIQWNALNAAAGTYFIRVTQNGETASRKMVLIK